jgi:arabinogalactan endo-1,4-beta-galactosidase
MHPFRVRAGAGLAAAWLAGAAIRPPGPGFRTPDDFVMGVDLSYVNQVLDHGGRYADSLGVRDPYAIFADHGANAVRLRLWHDPAWVRTEVYRDPAAPLYSGLDDVARAIAAARRRGMEVDLDFHYSDTWADPGRQDVPAAWRDITDLGVLEDSVYAYTRGVLEELDARGLLPEMVQVGNEINCGMLSTGAGPGFPALSVCEDRWQSQGAVLNAGIRAVRDVSADIRIVLHVAQPENVARWFDNITTAGGVTDFDVLGFSYYAPWSDAALSDLSGYVSRWRSKYGKDVMVMETAYPWTLEDADGYTNIFGAGSVEAGYPATPAGQLAYMTDLVQQVMDGGGKGVFYWEPACITSAMRDLWGTGSSWENNALFDFEGVVHQGMRFLTHPYAAPGSSP